MKGQEEGEGLKSESGRGPGALGGRGRAQATAQQAALAKMPS